MRSTERAMDDLVARAVQKLQDSADAYSLSGQCVPEIVALIAAVDATVQTYGLENTISELEPALDALCKAIVGNTE